MKDVSAPKNEKMTLELLLSLEDPQERRHFHVPDLATRDRVLGALEVRSGKVVLADNFPQFPYREWRLVASSSTHKASLFILKA